MISKITSVSFNRIFPLSCLTYGFLSCFGGNAKLDIPQDIQNVKTDILRFENWINQNRILQTDFTDLLEKEKDYYLYQNQKIYKDLTQAKNRMDFYFNEIQKISANKNLIFDDLRNNRTDSLNSIYENELTYAEEFGIIFSELNHLTKKFDDKKKQIIKIFRRDKKKLIFVPDQILLWEKDFNLLRYKREISRSKIAEFNILVNQIIINDSLRNGNILKQSRLLEVHTNELQEIESTIKNIEKIALMELKSYVCLRNLPSLRDTNLGGESFFNFEIKYYKGLKKYKEILFEMDNILNSF